jgi:transcriptional regulator with XRE-family HTH domain
VNYVSAALARRLKALRLKNGLTLDELSRRSGVSKGMLVEIEKGSANPSIGILCKTAAVLGVSVADVVNVAEAAPIRLVSSEETALLWRGPKGGTATLLAGTSGPDMLEFWRWRMLPGEVFDSPGHSLGTLELVHVQSGVLTMAVGDTKLEIAAGTTALARTDAPHSYTNTGAVEVLFFMTVAEQHR